MSENLTRRTVLYGAVTSAAASVLPASGRGLASALSTPSPVQETLPIASGPFQPNWDSLSHFQTPEWFEDAKLGFWAHWTAQCVPEQGDWYARSMYVEYNEDHGKRSLNHDYKYQAQHYGHPSYMGFKDIDHRWHAENWNPHRLIGLYKRAGAKYFVALANHHDNLDCFNSKYQPWNVMNIGPKRDIVGTWEREARSAGLKFGVTCHAARTWSWFEVAQGADADGPFQGIPYDGKLTKADGVGHWWEGYDPQDLYAQNHPIGAKPNQAYCEKFFNRVIDLINQYSPDLLYFDDYVMPLYDTDPSYGLRIAAHLYNTSAAKNGGKNECIMTGKLLNESQRKAITWDIERGLADRIEPFHWQTDTCIGDWHYSRWIYEHKAYKTPERVAHMLIDIISKNGNLLLNIPVRGNGEIDSEEEKFVNLFGDWMEVNQDAIHSTRPWVIYGEGPDVDRKQNGGYQSNFNEGSQQYSAADKRYVTKGDTIYAFFLGWPTGSQVSFKALGSSSAVFGKKVRSVELLGHRGKISFHQGSEGLTVELPDHPPCLYAYALRIESE